MIRARHAARRSGGRFASTPTRRLDKLMNNIVWLVGAVVIILAVLGFFGLR